MKKRILVILRVSSKAHGTEQQREIMRKWLNSLGYQDEEIEWLECVASARTPNSEYSQMVEDIKRLTTDDEIKTVAVWDISRLGRFKSELLRLKMFFYEHKIQLLIKEQDIKLFNDDGTISIGDNERYETFAAMAEQKDAR